ncbi:hypothetical protein GCM10008932_09050 [Alkalibacterium iburiense]|uniref:NERD domain-containing protein n=1 Tax=Alkalibacterium iburiense TaxID=290589 RepID=A0ABN0XA51_9LACT
METFILSESVDVFSFLSYLNDRMKLDNENRQKLVRLRKGDEGEKAFLKMFESLYEGEGILFYNFRASYQDSPIQIDFLFISAQSIYMYEVKNYQGSYVQSGDKFRSLSGSQFLNPSVQLTRTHNHFSHMLKELSCTTPIQPFVVFVNPEFTLYEAPVEDPFLFPGQLSSHFKLLNQRSDTIRKSQQRLVEKLLEESKKEATFERKLPTYHFEQLKKGLICYNCGSFALRNNSKNSLCTSCGRTCSLNDLILAHITEFQTLFPHEKLTRNSLYEWCGMEVGERRLWKLLKSHFKLEKSGKTSYYLRKDD